MNDEEIRAEAERLHTPRRYPSNPAHRSASDLAGFLWSYGREHPDVRVQVGDLLIPIGGIRLDHDRHAVILELDPESAIAQWGVDG